MLMAVSAILINGRHDLPLDLCVCDLHDSSVYTFIHMSHASNSLVSTLLSTGLDMSI